jgi:molybdopterin synthase catalytic subunit
MQVAPLSCRIAVELVNGPLDISAIQHSIADDLCGAQLLFCGSTRLRTGDRTTTFLRYQAYEKMAIAELRSIANEAAEEWPLAAITIHHRLGRVDVGQISIAVAISSPHRLAVMAAMPWMMDQVKLRPPIWKQEEYSDGSTEWVHPQ